jgi:hypothetical protein
MTQANEQIGSDGSPVEWWFNTKTNEVEYGRLTAAPHRLGPFESAEDAARALEILSARSREWNESEED